MHIEDRTLCLSKDDFNSLFDFGAVPGHIKSVWQGMNIGLILMMDDDDVDFTFADFDYIRIDMEKPKHNEGR